MPSTRKSCWQKLLASCIPRASSANIMPSTRESCWHHAFHARVLSATFNLSNTLTVALVKVSKTGPHEFDLRCSLHTWASERMHPMNTTAVFASERSVAAPPIAVKTGTHDWLSPPILGNASPEYFESFLLQPPSLRLQYRPTNVDKL
jgi:hypothetical protein